MDLLLLSLSISRSHLCFTEGAAGGHLSLRICCGPLLRFVCVRLYGMYGVSPPP